MRLPIHKRSAHPQRTSNPEASRTNVSEETLCTWLPRLASTEPGPPQESLVRDETRISLPAKPSLTRATLGQLCVAPHASRSRPAATEPWLEPRVSLDHCATREAHGAVHNWPSVVRVRRVWPAGISLSHRALATPVAGQVQCALTKVARCTVFPPTHWCGWLSGWTALC